MAIEVKNDDLPQLYDPSKCAYNCSSHHQIVAKHGQSAQLEQGVIITQTQCRK